MLAAVTPWMRKRVSSSMSSEVWPALRMSFTNAVLTSSTASRTTSSRDSVG